MSQRSVAHREAEVLRGDGGSSEQKNKVISSSSLNGEDMYIDVDRSMIATTACTLSVTEISILYSLLAKDSSTSDTYLNTTY